MNDQYTHPTTSKSINSWIILCGNKQRSPKWEQAKALYSELAIAKGSQPPSLVFGGVSKAGRGVGKLYIKWKKGVPEGVGVSLGKL